MLAYSFTTVLCILLPSVHAWMGCSKFSDLKLKLRFIHRLYIQYCTVSYTVVVYVYTACERLPGKVCLGSSHSHNNYVYLVV